MVLALDWDGTCTVDDSLVAAVRTHGDPAVYEREFESISAALEAEIGTLRLSDAEARAWARKTVVVRPGLHELAAAYAPVIVSSGLPQLILPVLEREGLLELEVHSNDAIPGPDGWRLLFRDEVPCPVCGDRCKRRALPQGHPLVYVGDGYSDRCASLAADRVFARDNLADYLAERGVSFERYETLHDVLDRL